MIYVVLVSGLAAAAAARRLRQLPGCRTEQRLAAAWAAGCLLLAMLMWGQW